MNAAAQRRLTVPLVAVVLVLGVLFLVLLVGVGRGVRWAPPRAPTPLPAQHAATLPPPVPLERYASVWQQPLFDPARKPVAHAASGGGQLGDMELTGIILTPTLRLALLRNKRGGDSGQELRVREGVALPDGSWTLVEVRPRSAVFDSASGRVELDLPAGAPIEPARGAQAGAGPTSASSVPNELPDDTSEHRLQPEPAGTANQPGGAFPDEPGPAGSATQGNTDNGNGAQSGAAALSALRGGDPARMQMSNEDRQAERLRQLKAAIQKRRAAQAAEDSEGDR